MTALGGGGKGGQAPGPKMRRGKASSTVPGVSPSTRSQEKGGREFSAKITGDKKPVRLTGDLST